MKTALRTAAADARGAEDSHSLTFSYPEEGGAASGDKYTGAADATSAAPGTPTENPKDLRDDKDPDGLP